jgi:ABC-type sugar transport system, periplasmic component
MKVKRIMVFVLTVVLAISMLAACGSQSGNGQAGTQSESTSSTTSAAPTTTQEELTQAELIYYCGGSGQPPETNLVEEAMDKILLEKINATIKLNFIPWGDYGNKMNVICASGDAFDLCFSGGWMNYGIMAAKGAYADLTELMQKYAKEYVAEMPAFVINAAQIGGKQYAAPSLQALGMETKLMVNSEIFDKYKFPSSIKSLDELDTYMDAIKNGEVGMTPLYSYTGSGSNQSFEAYLQAFDLYNAPSIGYYGADFKVINQYESNIAKTYYTWVRKAYQKGWISKSASTTKDDPNLLKSKKFAMVFSSSSPQLDSGGWSSYAPVTFKSISIGGIPKVLTGVAISTMYSINANSNNKERAMMYINLINTDKNLYNTLCYGVEGKHYVLKDGFVDLPGGITADKLGYNPGSNWEFGFVYNGYLRKGESADVNEKQLAFDKAATPDPALGFQFDSEPVKTEIANCQSVLEELAPALETGVVDPATGLATLVAKLKEAGSDKIITEKQKQLDAWRAANGK